MSPIKHPTVSLQLPHMDRHFHIPVGKQCVFLLCCWDLTCVLPTPLLIMQNFIAGIHRKVLPGCNWLIPTFPRLYPGARASLQTERSLLFPTMVYSVPSVLASVIWSTLHGHDHGLAHQAPQTCTAILTTSSGHRGHFGATRTCTCIFSPPSHLYLAQGRGVISWQCEKKSLFILSGRVLCAVRASQLTCVLTGDIIWGADRGALVHLPNHGGLPADHSQQKEKLLQIYPALFQHPNTVQKSQCWVSVGWRCGHRLPSADSTEPQGPSGLAVTGALLSALCGNKLIDIC